MLAAGAGFTSFSLHFMAFSTSNIVFRSLSSGLSYPLHRLFALGYLWTNPSLKGSLVELSVLRAQSAIALKRGICHIYVNTNS